MAHLSLVSSAAFKAQRKVTRRASSATSSCYLDGQHSLLSRPYLRWLGFGLASVLPLLAIFIVSILSGRDPREGYVAFSFGQGMPLWATYGLLGAGSVAFVFALASLGT